MHLLTVLLPSLPALTLAHPVWDKIQQHVFTRPSPTLAETRVQVYNAMGVNVSLWLSHQRGEDPDTKNGINYGYGEPGDVFPYVYSVDFETTRKDWDKWQAAIRFEDPDWYLWTEEFYGVIGENAAGGSIGFTLGLSGITTGLAPGEGRTNARFTIPGADFPKEAQNINSFILLEVANSIPSSSAVTVELMTRAEEWWQDQTFIHEKGSTNKTYLPFFFENNATKPYRELFNFKVQRSGARPLTTRLNPCELLPSDDGGVLTARVNEAGWSIETYFDEQPVVRCSGKWDKRRSAVDRE